MAISHAEDRSRPRRRTNGFPEALSPKPPFGRRRAYPVCAPELSSAWLSSRASFVHVALASLFAREEQRAGYAVSLAEREECRTRVPGLVDAYEHEHGAMRRSYFARHAFAAAAVTQKDELDAVWGTEESLRHPEYVSLLMRSQQLAYAASHRLAEFDRRHCQNMIFSVVVELLRRMDQAAASSAGATTNGAAPQADESGPAAESGPDAAPGIAPLAEELDKAEDFMLRCAARRAQVRYTKGMLWGAIPLAALIGLVVVASEAFGAASTDAREAGLALGAGAVGAIVSVLMRMTGAGFSMNLPTLDSEMRSTDLRLVGGLRPVVGAVFGFVVYALIKASLLPLDPPGEESKPFLYLTVAFLAGFSERLAQDVFASSGQGLLGGVGSAPSQGPSAGLSPPPGRPGP